MCVHHKPNSWHQYMLQAHNGSKHRGKGDCEVWTAKQCEVRALSKLGLSEPWSRAPKLCREESRDIKPCCSHWPLALVVGSWCCHFSCGCGAAGYKSGHHGTTNHVHNQPSCLRPFTAVNTFGVCCLFWLLFVPLLNFLSSPGMELRDAICLKSFVFYLGPESGILTCMDGRGAYPGSRRQSNIS